MAQDLKNNNFKVLYFKNNFNKKISDSKKYSEIFKLENILFNNNNIYIYI